MDVLAQVSGETSSSTVHAVVAPDDGSSSSAFHPAMSMGVHDSMESNMVYDDGEGGLDSTEEKRLKRMRRNRESAAQSRNRKKQYVEELEGQVKSLEDQVTALHQENYDLRREHARLMGQPFAELRPPALVSGVPPPGSGSDTATATVVADGESHPEAAAVIATAAPVAEPKSIERKPSMGATDALLGLELLSRSASCAGSATDATLTLGQPAPPVEALASLQAQATPPFPAATGGPIPSTSQPLPPAATWPR